MVCKICRLLNSFWFSSFGSKECFVEVGGKLFYYRVWAALHADVFVIFKNEPIASMLRPGHMHRLYAQQRISRFCHCTGASANTHTYPKCLPKRDRGHLFYLRHPPPPLPIQISFDPSSQKPLHERKWLMWLGLSVLLHQNPVMAVGNFVAPKSAGWGLASEISYSVAISVFFVVTLCIADGVRRDTNSGGSGKRGALEFYVPKVRALIDKTTLRHTGVSFLLESFLSRFRVVDGPTTMVCQT